MTAKYYAILTNQGAEKLAAATARGTQIHITQMAVGDGNGALPVPDATQTQLLNQKRIGAVNTLTVDADNPNQIIAQQVIPENEGGFWIRELGLFDDEGTLIAIANCPETYKPLLQEGSGRTQTIRMSLIVSSAAAVTLKIDPSVVLATRKYVDDKVIEVKAYSEDLMKQHLSSANPHDQYLMIGNALKELQSAGLVAEALKNLGLGEAAKQGVATNAQMVAGTATNLLPSVATVMSLFSKRSYSANDFIRIPDVPGGLIIQWGTVISGNFGDTPWTYPTPFPNARLGVWGAFHRMGTSGSDYPTISFNNISDPTPKSLSNFMLRISGNGGAGYTAFVFAIGY
ncbi:MULTISPECIES: phage tail protein [Kosakonia]|uniref:phage tail protein n=1 Tax=Kosakonia TaxID=1330547 RepID=UPI001362183D|nr:MULTISPECIES: phage tail protein [Kosakonia]QHM93799.1 phage tail protein [Kosakonia sacchari]